MPLTAVYFVLPPRIALAAASLMCSGVSKSGSPAPSPITSRPWALSSAALVVTAMVGDGLMRPSREAKKDTGGSLGRRVDRRRRAAAPYDAARAASRGGIREETRTTNAAAAAPFDRRRNQSLTRAYYKIPISRGLTAQCQPQSLGPRGNK